MSNQDAVRAYLSEIGRRGGAKRSPAQVAHAKALSSIRWKNHEIKKAESERKK
jgi:hypothetical protein